MKFWVTRTSNYHSVTKPCEGAVAAVKTWKRPIMEHGKQVGEETHQEAAWQIELSSVEDVVDLVDSLGEDIIFGRDIYTGEPDIEIYDDYRE